MLLAEDFAVRGHPLRPGGDRLGLFPLLPELGHLRHQARALLETLLLSGRECRRLTLTRRRSLGCHSRAERQERRQTAHPTGSRATPGWGLTGVLRVHLFLSIRGPVSPLRIKAAHDAGWLRA